MLEFDLEDDFVRWAEAQGGVALKVKIEGVRGFPDRIVLLPGGRIAFVELKRKGKCKIYPQQMKWLKKLQSLGFVATLSDDLEEIIDHIDFAE